jgi:tetratricopeptide (TPR) repeat protein
VTTTAGKIITFYSYKGGVGRTMALANLAWIMASAGRNVLVVDWDLESPGLHRYLGPFLLDPDLVEYEGVVDMVRGYALSAQSDPATDRTELRRQFADVGARAQRLRWQPPEWGYIDFLGPGLQNDAYESAVASFSWSSFFEQFDGREFFAAMRASMLAGGYDYILIDSRTGLSDNAGICTKLLPDTVVVGFTMSAQAIQGGAAVAYDIEKGDEGGRAVRVLPVPMRVEDAENAKLQVSRAVARRAFTGLPRGMDARQRLAYWGGVEIPYRAFYAYEEVLAALGDEPGIAGTLLGAYERLAAAVSDHDVTAYRNLAEAERISLLKRFERFLPAQSLSATVVAAPRGRMWADWINTELSRADIDVRRLPTGSSTFAPIAEGATVIAVLTDDLLASAQADVLGTTILQRFDSLSERVPNVIALRVEPTDLLPEPFSLMTQIDLTTADEQDARTKLLDQFGGTQSLLARSGRRGSTGTRFPNRLPAVGEFPAVTPRFVGRVTYLETLRDHFRWGAGTVPAVLLRSQPGFGKTEIALEYVRRFAADYDTVWWVRAENPDEARRSLRELEARLARGGPAPTSSADDSAEDSASVVAMLEALRRGELGGRWLLVYHKATNPLALGHLLANPSPYGHVLVTTSDDGGWPDSVRSIPVEGFDPDESLALLGTWLPIDPDMRDLVDRLDNLPEAVNRAGLWMAQSGLPAKDAAEQYLEEFDRKLNELASRRATDAGFDNGIAPEVAASWALSIQTLGEARQASLRLLELCTFLSPDGVSMDLLNSPGMLDRLATLDDEIRQTRMASRVFGDLARAQLARVDHRRRTIRLHRIVLEMLGHRMRVQGTADERRAEVLKVLTDYAPINQAAGSPLDDNRFVELQRHLVACGAADSLDEKVRRWLVYQTSYLRRTGRPAEALAVGVPLLARWRNELENGERDFLRLWLANHVANAYRALGEDEKAQALDQQTYRLQLATLGRHHLHTLRTARNLGADQRSAGRLQVALVEDTTTYRGFARELGDDDPDTLTAAHNLAYCLFLSGDPKAALERGRKTFERRLRTLGAADSYTWETALSLGLFHAQLGEYDQAEKILREAITFYEKEGRRTDQALADRLLAVVRRLRGDYVYARRHHEEALAVFRDVRGVDHVETLACAMSLAIDQHLLGVHSAAMDIGRDVLARYERRFTGTAGREHPLVHLCRADLSIFLRAGGDVERARELSGAALAGLRDDEQVGPSHFLTLAVAVNHANNLVAAGDVKAALRLDEQTCAAFNRFYSAAYPDTAIVTANLADSRRVDDSGPTAIHRRVHTETHTETTGRRDIPIEIPLP